MGSSIWQNISYNIEIIRRIKPKKILDIGVGFGKWGFLSREYLDVWNERVHSSSWEIQIDGIEIFEQNIEEHQKKIYSNIYIIDAIDYMKSSITFYDLIIIGDVLEHFNKKDATEFLGYCLKSSKYVMLNIPIGKFWQQDAVYDNIYEKHLSVWTHSDFNAHNIIKKKNFRYSILRPYSVFIFSNFTDGLPYQNKFIEEIRFLLYSYPKLYFFAKKIKTFFWKNNNV